MGNIFVILSRWPFIPAVCLLCSGAFAQVDANALPIPVKGVYGNPEPLWQQGYELNELGINAIFVHSGALTPDMIDRAKAEGIRVFAEFATLNGKNYVEAHPEAWAIDKNGKKVAPASWFMGVCPTEPGFRNFRKDQLRQLLTELPVDGVWLDYVHWHAQFEDPEPILPETCFSTSCMEAFSETYGMTIPKGTTSERAAWILENHEESWRDWRCQVLASWVREMRDITHELRPNALLGLYHCPWADSEFGNARRRILGLDYDLLKDIVDVFSPMVYHKRMGRPPKWVAENIAWFGDALGIENRDFPQIWPIVQAHNDPGRITAEEFAVVLRGGLAGPSSGVMMFTTNAVAEDAAKIGVMKAIYNAPEPRR